MLVSIYPQHCRHGTEFLCRLDLSLQRAFQFLTKLYNSYAFTNDLNQYIAFLKNFISFFAFYLMKVVQNLQIWNRIAQFCSVLKINIGKIIDLNLCLYFKSLLVTIVSLGTSSIKHFLSPSAKWKYKPVE